MTPKEATQVLAILKAAYPNSYKGMTKEEAIGTVNVWAMQFSNMPADIVMMAINKLIATSQFPPAISEVKNKLSSLYWEAYEELRMHKKQLTEEQIKYFQYIKENTKDEQYRTTEPKIREMMGNNKQFLLGGE